MYVIVVGNPFNGLKMYGSFATNDDAMRWGVEHAPDDEWYVVELLPAMVTEELITT